MVVEVVTVRVATNTLQSAPALEPVPPPDPVSVRLVNVLFHTGVVGFVAKSCCEDRARTNDPVALALVVTLVMPFVVVELLALLLAAEMTSNPDTPPSSIMVSTAGTVPL